MTHVNLEDLYQVACDKFPAELTTTGCTQGEFEAHDGMIEYSEEFEFTACQLFDDIIVGGGWIELRQDSPDEEPIIYGIFSLSRNSDWQHGRILPENVALQGYYDIEAEKWDLSIDAI